ncbi:uncharacterized protein BDZ99DRAFT_341644, partial [Mytilinidion resinicola]
CYQRDQKKCILTKSGEPIKVAHIYPFSMRHEDKNVKQTVPFWRVLEMFWSKERVDAWHSAVFPHGTEVCQNLICLAPHAHAYWAQAYFALKPIRISEDKKCLEVQLFWLLQNARRPTVQVQTVPSLAALDLGPNSVKLFDNQTNQLISSGSEISLTTDDPVLRPLPDMALLEMQWFLHRIAAMSGAVEQPQDNFDDGDDDD